MFCLDCGYDLRGSTAACPECGRCFDERDEATWAQSAGRHVVRKGIRLIVRWCRRIALLAIILLLVLRFGNPRWNRWIYIFQAYVWPGSDDSLVLPPAGYSGTWQIWARDGTLWHELPIENGKLDGELDGRIPTRMIWNWPAEVETLDAPDQDWIFGRGKLVQGRREGLWVVRGWKYGNPSKGYYRDGRREGPWFVGETINHGRVVIYYKDDEVERKEEYNAAHRIGFDLELEDWPEIYYTP